MDSAAIASSFQEATRVDPRYFLGLIATLSMALTVLWAVLVSNRLFLVAARKKTFAGQAWVMVRWVFAVLALPITYVFILIFAR